MKRALKVAAPSGLWGRRAGDLQGLWPRSAMAMATKIKVDGGKNSSGIDQGAPGVNPAERQAFRDDMDNSYGGAYSQRSADEGYGERYGEAVKVADEKKKNTTELQRGETAERDQNEDAVVDVQYDVSQGEHVAEKEVSRHRTILEEFMMDRVQTLHNTPAAPSSVDDLRACIEKSEDETVNKPTTKKRPQKQMKVLT